MKKGTKLLSVFVIAGSIGCMTGALTGCGHQHTFSDQWSTSETQHWHEATCEHTDEKSDLGNHVDADGNYICDICEYQLTPPVSEYTVTFDLNGHGAAIAAATTVQGKITAPASPVDGDYNFVGWYDNADCTGTAIDFETKVFTENTTIYAKWTAKTVTFDMNGHGETIDGAAIVNGKITAPAAPVDDDYDFGGWYENADCTGTAIDFATKVFAESATVYAKWTERDIAAELDLEVNYFVGTELELYNNRVKSCAVYKEGSSTPLADDEGVVILAEEGVYEYVVVQMNDKPTRIKFQAVDPDKLVYRYATAEEGANSFNFHISYADGGTRWLKEFEGEYGVRATKEGHDVSSFQFEIGNTPFEFDAVKVRVYFATDAADKIRICSWYSTICEGASAVSANEWVDLVIPRSAIQTGGSYFGAQHGGRIDTDENFYEDVFGTIGYNNQQAFKFDLYKDGTSTLISAGVYLSSVRYMPASGIEHVYNAFDTAASGTVLNKSQASYLWSYEGEYGVVKADNVQSNFSFDIGSQAFTFDYINVRVYLASEKSSVNIYCGDNLVAENVATNQWVTLKITSDMVNNANGHFMKVCGWYPLLAPSNMFDPESTQNQKMFYFDVKDSAGAAVDVTAYLSYIGYDPLTPRTVSFNTNGHGSEVASVQTSQGNRIASADIPANPTDDNHSFGGWYANAECTGDAIDLATYAFNESVTLYARWIERDIVAEVGCPASYASGTTLELFNDRVKGASVYKQGASTPLTVTGGAVTLTDAGIYEYKITKTNDEVITITFSVEDRANNVYSWSTADEDVNSFNFHISYPNGTDWLREYEGEYGVRKTKSGVGEFQFEIGKNSFEFDSVVVRVYFETSAAERIRLYSHYSMICEGDTAVAANQWVNLIIPRSAIQTGGSIFGVNGGRTDTDENFYADVFGTIGYNNQQAFKFTIYNAADNSQISSVVYISSVSYMNATKLGNNEKAVYKFAGPSDGALNDGASMYMWEYQGEYGLKKANSEQSWFKFDIGVLDNRFDFDYIKVRIYLQTADVASVKLVGGKVVITDSLETNKWVDLIIPKSAVQNAENAAYDGQWFVPDYLADDKFPEIAFVSAYNMFKFDICKSGTNEALNATVYISCVSYGFDPERAETTCHWCFSCPQDDGINTDRASLGGSTWLNGYKGEFGVSKGNNCQSIFAFSLWNVPYVFDYLKVRVYFESEKDSVNVYCGNVLVAENVATNQWVTLTIQRSMIQNAQSAFYLSRPDLANETYLSDEKFLSAEIAFSQDSWYAQRIFRFNLKDSGGNEATATTYVAYIDHGVVSAE